MSAVQRLPQPDWLHHRLDISGPAPDLAAFRNAAAGAGVVPWHIDHARLEEDWFHLLIAPASGQRGISVAGARILARQLRDADWAAHQDALSRIGRFASCPFDLHALVPVPPDILRRGPEDPRSLTWLWENWGTTWALRRVTEVAPPRGATGPTFSVTFWSADWTPWQVIRRLRSQWQMLRFGVMVTIF